MFSVYTFDRSVITEKCFLSMNVMIASLMIMDNGSCSDVKNSIVGGKDFSAL